MVHRGQDKLRGTAFGADDQIQAARIAGQRFRYLLAGQYKQRDARRAQRHEQYVDQGGQRGQEEIGQRQSQPAHGALSRANSPSSRPRTRWS